MKIRREYLGRNHLHGSLPSILEPDSAILVERVPAQLAVMAIKNLPTFVSLGLYLQHEFALFCVPNSLSP